jgi:hypothetical protein
MKHLVKPIALAAVALFALAACSAFTYTANDLKGKTLTYYVDFSDFPKTSANGHDNTVLVFDATGTAGAITVANYTNDFKTAADYATGDYTKKAWFQTGGSKGTFTYDPDTMTFTTTIDTVYLPALTSTAIHDSIHPAADYSYQLLDTYYTAAFGQTHTGMTYVSTFPIQLTADTGNYALRAGSAANTWVSTIAQSQSATVNGVFQSMAMTNDMTNTITDGSMVSYAKYTFTDTSGSTVSTDYEEDTTTYKIAHAFIVGQDDTAGETFADVWKKGNTVTFQFEQTGYTEIGYATTAPAAPTVGTNGTGLTGVRYTDPWYYIDNNVQDAGAQTLTNNGDYLVLTASTLAASRNLHPLHFGK